MFVQMTGRIKGISIVDDLSENIHGWLLTCSVPMEPRRPALPEPSDPMLVVTGRHGLLLTHSCRPTPGPCPLAPTSLQSSDRMLIVMDRHGLLLSRSWCLWEIWQVGLRHVL